MFWTETHTSSEKNYFNYQYQNNVEPPLRKKIHLLWHAILLISMDTHLISGLTQNPKFYCLLFKKFTKNRGFYNYSCAKLMGAKAYQSVMIIITGWFMSWKHICAHIHIFNYLASSSGELKLSLNQEMIS